MSSSARRAVVDEVVDVVGRPEQAELLGTPPGEPHLVAQLLLELLHLDRGLEQRGAARAVVVDARTALHAVEVRSGHHHVVGATAPGLGDDVPGTAGSSKDVEVERGLGGQGRHERGSVGLRDAGGRGEVGRRLAEGSVERPVNVVVDDRRRCARRLGEGGLVGERAGAAADQRDLAGGVDAVPVARVAARDGRGLHQPAVTGPGVLGELVIGLLSMSAPSTVRLSSLTRV